jgi:hypothetical protein
MLKYIYILTTLHLELQFCCMIQHLLYKCKQLLLTIIENQAFFKERNLGSLILKFVKIFIIMIKPQNG